MSLCRLHVSHFFGGRAGFDVDASHILSQGVLAAITLVGGMAYDGETRACTEYETEILGKSRISLGYRTWKAV